MTFHEITLFVQKWSPYIWLFGSLFGVFMSGILLKRSYEQRVVLRASDRQSVSAFWFRHAIWFFLLHFSYVVVGIIAVAKIDTDWSNLLILLVLLLTPLTLVYRSYDSLRVNSNGKYE